MPNGPGVAELPKAQPDDKSRPSTPEHEQDDRDVGEIAAEMDSQFWNMDSRFRHMKTILDEVPFNEFLTNLESLEAKSPEGDEVADVRRDQARAIRDNMNRAREALEELTAIAGGKTQSLSEGESATPPEEKAA